MSQPLETVVDISSQEMEPHVAKAIAIAVSRAGAAPVTAQHLLEGAALAGRDSSSTAFRTLGALLEGAVVGPDPGGRRWEPGPEVTMSYETAAGFELVQSHLRGEWMWGRHFVASALLSKSTTLDVLAKSVGRTPDELRDEWYRFVTSQRGSQPREWWAELWGSAGFTVPADAEDGTSQGEASKEQSSSYAPPEGASRKGAPTKSGPAGKTPSDAKDPDRPEKRQRPATKGADDLPEASAEPDAPGTEGAPSEADLSRVQDAPSEADGPADTTAYLFTWNPELFEWPELESQAKQVADEGSTLLSWSTGNRRSVAQGAHVFLMRQGGEPRGIVAHGRVAGEIQELPHWDPGQRDQGRTYHRVDVRWDALAREPILSRDVLKREVADVPLWDSGAGGVSIGPDLLAALDPVWRSAVPDGASPVDTGDGEEGAEGGEDVAGTGAEQSTGAPDGAVRPFGDDDELPVRQTDFSSDSDSGEDLLNTRREVATLAAIMAAKSVVPPLSIGLFGPWGSGKSFFMNLLKKEIRRLERLDEAYCDRVVQISFNAWHYIDSNLWASLANEVFEQLGQAVEAGVEDTKRDGELTAEEKKARAADRRRERVRLLMAARRSRSELQEAEEHRRSLANDLESAREELLTLKDTKWILASAHGASNQVADEALRRFVTNPELRVPVDDALSQLGVTSEDLSPRMLRLRFTRLQGRFRLGRQLLTALTIADVGHWLLALALAAAAVWLVPVLVQFQTELIERIATMGATLVAVLSPHLGTVSRIRTRVQPVADRFASFVEDERAALEAAGAERLKDIERQSERAQARVDAAGEQLAEAEEDLKNLLQDRRIMEFVQQRQRSEVYRQHLGVIAQARQDFEYLSLLLQPEDPEEEEEPITPRAKELERELDNYRDDAPAIDRIVLYIDDLDRCPERKVVEVLQAVHLLLAFKLFVVVVGVDPRWLLHSLAESSDVFQRGDRSLTDAKSLTRSGSSREQHWRSTPMDYLEKIFQIPFHLRPMGEAGFRALVGKLTEPRADGVRAGDGAAGAGAAGGAGDADGIENGALEGGVDVVGAVIGPEGRAGEADPNASAESGDARLAAGSDAHEEAPAEGPPTGEALTEGAQTEGAAGISDGEGERGSAQRKGDDEPGSASQTGEVDADAHSEEPLGASEPSALGDAADDGSEEASSDDDAAPPRPRLDIAEWERRFMGALHPFIGSPRSTKRFINVYRVVRSAHLDDIPEDGAIGTAVGQDGGSPHLNVLFLLGMLTGFPGPSISLFREIRKAPEEFWSGLLERWTSTLDERGRAARAVLAAPITGRPDEDVTRRAARTELARIAQDRELLRCTDMVLEGLDRDGMTFDPPLRGLRRWIPKVARYSFRSGQDLRED